MKQIMDMGIQDISAHFTLHWSYGYSIIMKGKQLKVRTIGTKAYTWP
jgi:hypothetical protein